jgi:hypothetical protein
VDGHPRFHFDTFLGSKRVIIPQKQKLVIDQPTILKLAEAPKSYHSTNTSFFGWLRGLVVDFEFG